MLVSCAELFCDLTMHTRCLDKSLFLWRDPRTSQYSQLTAGDQDWLWCASILVQTSSCQWQGYGRLQSTNPLFSPSKYVTNFD